jgi:hypothetical protein
MIAKSMVVTGIDNTIEAFYRTLIADRDVWYRRPSGRIGKSFMRGVSFVDKSGEAISPWFFHTIS